MRQPRFAFLFALSSFACLGVVVALGAGSACTFSRDEGQPDTFVPEQDVAGDDGLVQPPVTCFDAPTSTDVDCDYSCKARPYDAGAKSDAAFDAGVDGAAPGGEMIDLGLKLYAFGSGNTQVLPGATVDVFFGNEINGTSPDLAGLIADGAGIVHVVAPAGWRIAYRIPQTPNPDPTKALEAYDLYDLELPFIPGATVEAAGITGDESARLKLAITGDSSFTPPPGTAIFATRIVDCRRRNTRSTTLEVFDLDTGTNIGPLVSTNCTTGVPCRVYVADNETPGLSLSWTSRAGLAIVANLDASHHYRAIAKGKRQGSPDVEVLGQRDMELQPATIDVEYIYP